jgi:hypothetical protein
MTNIQQTFNRVYEEVRSDPDTNNYTCMLRALKAVFKENGYNITAKELGWDYHNYIVGSCDKTDFTQIAESFVGWIRPISELPYELRSIPTGLGWELEKIYPGTPDLSSLERDVVRYIKENKLRKNTKAYSSFIEEYRDRVYSVVKDIVINHQEACRDAVSSAKTYAEDNMALKRGYITYTRLYYVVNAFIGVAKLQNTPDFSWVLALANQLERKLDLRMAAYEGLQDHIDNLDIDMVVKNSLRNSEILKNFVK